MLELTHVHVLFRNSHFANDLNFNVNEPVRVEVEVYVDFATSLLFISSTIAVYAYNSINLKRSLFFKLSKKTQFNITTM